MNDNETLHVILSLMSRERKYRMPNYQTGVTVLEGICKQLRHPNMLQLMNVSNNLFIHLFNALKLLHSAGT